jgi:hypothetical protein
MRALATEMRESKKWANEHASKVYDVYLDEWRYRISIDVGAEPAKVAAAAERAFGVNPQVILAKHDYNLQTRRIETDNVLQGGQAIWETTTPSPAVDDAFCTTGFRMSRGSNSNLMTTAGHCGSNGKQWWHPAPASFFAKTSSNWYPSTDISLLGPTGLYTFGFSRYSWFGAQNTNTSYPISAKMISFPIAGSAYYINGANSGLIYGRVLDATDVCSTDDPNHHVQVIMDTQTGRPSDGTTFPGDSGAPVTSWNTATPETDLIASGSLTCGNGSNRSVFEAINVIESVSGATVVTGGN